MRILGAHITIGTSQMRTLSLTRPLPAGKHAGGRPCSLEAAGSPCCTLRPARPAGTRPGQQGSLWPRLAYGLVRLLPTRPQGWGTPRHPTPHREEGTMVISPAVTWSWRWSAGLWPASVDSGHSRGAVPLGPTAVASGVFRVPTAIVAGQERLSVITVPPSFPCVPPLPGDTPGLVKWPRTSRMEGPQARVGE